jgi:hypothetical protein
MSTDLQDERFFSITEQTIDDAGRRAFPTAAPRQFEAAP